MDRVGNEFAMKLEVCNFVSERKSLAVRMVQGVDAYDRDTVLDVTKPDSSSSSTEYLMRARSALAILSTGTGIPSMPRLARSLSACDAFSL